MAETHTLKGRWKNSTNPLPFLCRRELGPDDSQLGHSLLRKRISVANNLYRRDLKAHYGCVNAIEFSHGGGEWITSGGDDRRVLLWNVQRALWDIGEPASMKGEHISNIFCLAFDQDNKKVFSGGNDEQVIVHDIVTGETVDVFRHEDAVYGLSIDPNNVNVFASACDDGRVLIYDIREPASTDPFCLANYTSSMHAVMYNPIEPRLLATANAREGVGLWDIRKPKTCCLRYGGSYVQQSCMSVRISRLGDKVIALRRRLPPVLYQTHSPEPVCEFDHSGYYNSCTMKSCSFAGENDEYILSGSDDFNLYMWRIPDDLSHRQYTREAHMVLKGHRSIVNQVRYNPSDSLVLSSGVEKIVKVWNPFPMPNSSGDLERSNTSDLSERPVFTPEEYINLVLRSGHIMSHDYSHQSTEEDPRMMAFFDSLVQGEMDMSSDDLSSNEEELYERIVQVTRSEVDASEHEGQDEVSSVNSGEESDFSPFTLAFASVMAAQTSEGTGHTRLLDAQDSNNSGAEDARDSNDQRSGSRRSIAEIIAQNRKEVLKAIETKQKTVTGKERTSRSSARTTSTSDSDSSDEEPTVKKSKSSTVINDCTKLPEKQKVRCHLKRLRELRNRAMNSDSESSDTGVSAKRLHIDSESSATEMDNSVSESNVHDKKSTEQTVSCTKDCGGPGLGPYLHETDAGHGSRLGCASEKSSSQNSNTELPKADHQSDSIRCTKNTDDVIDKELQNNVDDCVPSTSRCEADACNGKNKEKSRKNLRSKSSNCSEETADVSNSCDNEESKEPLWNEFKRFKNRLERARRYYRKHSSSQPSSDDD
ncbi:DDB1- and CUL4-associated factor 5-like isoform X1 [Haliotis cracherodii]|uniref:DDB1- and CUL4-associated factor 5-like isoform X1 n=1 Tax=Haliotis cracherodii TaxID=6455 RepID=UPI0039EAE0C3